MDILDEALLRNIDIPASNLLDEMFEELKAHSQSYDGMHKQTLVVLREKII